MNITEWSGRLNYRNSLLVSIIGAFLCLGACSGSSVTSEEDVQKYAPGVWTHKGLLYREAIWSKYVFNEDGTGEKYLVRGKSDGWGTPKAITWKPTNGRNLKTKGIWYGVWVEGDGLGERFILVDSNSLGECPMYQTKIIAMYDRGDTSPYAE